MRICVCVWGLIRFLSQLGRICGLSEGPRGVVAGFYCVVVGGFPGSRFRVQCC